MDVGMEMEGNRFLRRLDRWMAWGLLAALFVYAWFRIWPDLIYFTFGTYSPNPRHEPGWAFFARTASLSGGVVLYIGGILSQLFVVPCLGAGAIVFTTGLAYAAVRGLPMHWGTFRRWAGWAPVILLVMIWQQYDHPMTLTAGLAMNLGMAALLSQFRGSVRQIRLAVFVAAMGLLYWWTAGISAVFAVVMALEAILVRRSILEGVLLALSAAGLMWGLGTWTFCLETTDVWLRLTPFHPIARGELTGFSWPLATAAFLWAPAAFGLSEIVYWILNRRKSGAAPKRRGQPVRSAAWLRVAVSVVWRLGLVAAAGWGLRYSHQVNELSEKDPLALRAGQAVRAGDWQRAVDAGTQLKQQGRIIRSVIHDVDRALARMGLLGDRMFEFPQDLPVLLYYNIQSGRDTIWFDKFGGLMFDLGYMNSAEHMTTEILELEGPMPFVLDRLAWIARIKGQDAAARVFETVLSGQIAHRLAESLWPGADGTFHTPDQRLDQLTQYMPTHDREVRDTAPDELMLTLLADQPKNRMAFDYLMAYYLLTFQQDKVVSQFYRLKDLGYQRLPRHYAEAALIARDKTRGQIDLQGWTIDPEIETQYKAITQRAKELRMDRRQAAEALAPEFGNSYFFYSMFSISGVGR
jgi:hypothetical protein